jgi:hypothetical protein
MVGGAVCAAIAGWYLVTTFIPGRDDVSSSLELKRRMLLKQKETLQEEDVFKARISQYQERLKQDQGRFLPGENPSLASAELQKVLSDLAEQVGVEITQKNIQKEQKLQEDLVKVSVRIETNCNPVQLVQFLAAIHNYQRHLTLDELVVNGFRIQRRFEIRPNMTVSGLIAVPETKAEDKPAAEK